MDSGWIPKDNWLWLIGRYTIEIMTLQNSTHKLAWVFEYIKARASYEEFGLIHVNTETFAFNDWVPGLQFWNTFFQKVCDDYGVISIQEFPWHRSEKSPGSSSNTTMKSSRECTEPWCMLKVTSLVTELLAVLAMNLHNTPGICWQAMNDTYRPILLTKTYQGPSEDLP